VKQIEQLLATFGQPMVVKSMNGGYLIYLPEDWQAASCTVSAGHSPYQADHRTNLGIRANDAILIDGLSEAPRYYFKLQHAQKASLVLGERLLAFRSTCNFRDLGGYRTQSGSYLQWNKVFRSDHLGHMSVAELRQLEQLGIRTIVDFRGPEEYKQFPVNLPEGSRLNFLHLPIAQGNVHRKLRKLVLQGKGNTLNGKEFLLDANRFFASGALPELRRFFTLLKDPGNLPLVFNCNAGKDRTGFVAAVLLKMLGVPESTIMQDYLASNIFRQAVNDDWLKRGSFFMQPETLKPFILVDEQYLWAAFDEVRQRFGDWQRYWNKALVLNDADISRLQQQLLC